MAEEQQRQRGKGQAQAGEAKRQQWFPLPGLAGSGMPPGAGSQQDLQQATSSPSLSARGTAHRPQKRISRAPRCTSFR